jgi:hypothetical protein
MHNRPDEESASRAAPGGTPTSAGSGLISRIGTLEIDWPRSLGFYGGIALAVGAGVIDPPFGLFIAAVPFIKMLDLPRLPNRVRFVAQVLEGVAKPVNGDSEGTIRIVTAEDASDPSAGAATEAAGSCGSA